MTIDAIVINWLRVANLIALAASLVVLVKPARRAFTKKPQPGDMVWMLFWFDALNRAWFVARNIHFDEGGYVAWEAELIVLCYVFAIAIQFAIVRAYLWGRS